MGFLNVLWRVITTMIVIAPKVWPFAKRLIDLGLDRWAKKRIGADRDEELKKAAKKAEETKDASELEDLLGSGKTVSVHLGGSDTVSAVEPGPLIAMASFVDEEEKKNPQSPPEPSENPTLSTLSSVAKIAAAGFGVYILSSMLSKKEAQAASMGVGGTSSSVILGATPNRNYFRGSPRLGSKIIP